MASDDDLGMKIIKAETSLDNRCVKPREKQIDTSIRSLRQVDTLLLYMHQCRIESRKTMLGWIIGASATVAVFDFASYMIRNVAMNPQLLSQDGTPIIIALAVSVTILAASVALYLKLSDREKFIDFELARRERDLTDAEREEIDKSFSNAVEWR